MAMCIELTKEEEKEVVRNIGTAISIISCYPKDMTVGEVMDILKKQYKEFEEVLWKQ